MRENDSIEPMNHSDEPYEDKGNDEENAVADVAALAAAAAAAARNPKEPWNDYDEKGPWTLPEGAAMIVKQIAAETIFWELVDSVVVDESRSADHRLIAHLIHEYPGLTHRTYKIQWDNENETRELYPLAILACLQPPSIELLEFVYKAYPAALSHQESVKGTMPFHYACTFRASLEVIDWMMEKDPSCAKIPRNDGMYPLHLAIFFKAPLEVVNRLLEAWPAAAQQDYEGEWSILHAAAAGQASLDLVKRIYELNPESILSLDERRRTPLHQACWKRGNLPVIRFLVECAPQVLEMEDDSSETPLFRAARNQSLEVMQYLLTAMAQNNHRHNNNDNNNNNNHNHPARHHHHHHHHGGHAPAQNNAAAAAATLPPFPPLDDLGATLLHFAALDNTEDVVEFLLQKHPEMATVQTRCRDRYTPLHSACHYSGGGGGGAAAAAAAKGANQDHNNPNTITNHNNHNSPHPPQQQQQHHLPNMDNSHHHNNNKNQTTQNSNPPRTSNLANFKVLVRHSPQVLTMVNGDGKTPLETAEEVGSAEEVVAYLQQVTPPEVKSRRRNHRNQKKDKF